MLGGVESLYVCVCVHIKVLSESLYIQQVLLSKLQDATIIAEVLVMG